MSASAWQGLAAAISSDRVLLGPEAARLILTLLKRADRDRLRDGVGPTPQMAKLREVLEVVVSGDGHADVRQEVDLPLFTQDEGMTTQEVAQVLGLGDRQTRRLVSSGAFGRPRRIGRGYLVDRAQVDAHRAIQREDAS